MAGQNSEVYRWLSSISHGLNLERLAPEFERRGFRSIHSLKYIEQNDLEIILNSPDKLLLAERRILEKEIEDIKKPSLQPKELFPTPASTSLQVTNPNNSAFVLTTSSPVASCSNVFADGMAVPSISQSSAVNDSATKSVTYNELSENLTIIQTQIRSANEQLEIARSQHEQASSKASGRKGKLCTRCHQPGHYKARCTNPTCTNMNICGASEKHPESKSEIMELQKLVNDLQKKEAKAAEELQSF